MKKAIGEILYIFPNLFAAYFNPLTLMLGGVDY
jgi:hypothetical protein